MQFDIKVRLPGWLGGSGRGFPWDRFRTLAQRALEAGSAKIVSDAKDKLDATTSGSGLLGQSLSWDVNGLVSEIAWGYPYGHVIEYGPDQRSWTIEAKYAKALRFPSLNSSGAVEYIQYIPRGTSVLHVWESDHKRLRPHVVPAVEENMDQISSDIGTAIVRALD